jgi:hypothetical protein
MSHNDTGIAESQRSTLILAALGLAKQSRSYHMTSLLAIQLEQTMQRSDLTLVKMHATTEITSNDDHQSIPQQAYSMWPLPRVSKIDNEPDATRLKNLIRQAEGLGLST